MNCILKGGSVYIGGKFVTADITVENSTIKSIGVADADYPVTDCTGYHIFPGFTDVHVHLREPGFSYKETIKSGTRAAARGGYTAVCAMPNLKPVPDSVQNLDVQKAIIKKDAVINVYPYGAITKNEAGDELSDMEEMSASVAAFSDDGRGVQSAEVMERAMERAKSLGKIVAAHCEDNSLLYEGYIHKGEYAEKHGHKGICSESEWKHIERDLELVKKTGCAYHVCHISTKESVWLIRKAKAAGLPVTCETAPHYLVLSDNELEEDGRFKMNPPLRGREDRAALVEGICDGTIDMIATDHAPHSTEEKSGGLKNSLMGISGIETAFPVLYTELVKPGIISLEKLITLMHDNPNKRFCIGCDIEEGKNANLTVFDLDKKYRINSSDFLSKGKSTPFEGKEVFGKCVLTICEGDIVWKENLTEN